jgi:hypothetical protein
MDIDTYPEYPDPRLLKEVGDLTLNHLKS